MQALVDALIYGGQQAAAGDPFGSLTPKASFDAFTWFVAIDAIICSNDPTTHRAAASQAKSPNMQAMLSLQAMINANSALRTPNATKSTVPGVSEIVNKLGMCYHYHLRSIVSLFNLVPPFHDACSMHSALINL